MENLAGLQSRKKPDRGGVSFCKEGTQKTKPKMTLCNPEWNGVFLVTSDFGYDQFVGPNLRYPSKRVFEYILLSNEQKKFHSGYCCQRS